MGVPQNSLQWKILSKGMIWGTPYFRKPPNRRDSSIFNGVQ